VFPKAFRLPVFFALVACGGGGEGGPPEDFPLIPEDDETRDPMLEIVVEDEAGAPLNALPILEDARLKVRLEVGGRGMEGTVLSFEGENIVPEVATALTDEDGEAVVVLSATRDSVPGQATVTVTHAEETSARVFLTVQAAKLQLGHLRDGEFVPGEIDIGSPLLLPEATTTLRLAIADENGRLVTESLNVNLSSPCANADPPLAELSAMAVSSRGLVSASYTAAGCERDDRITADLEPLSPVTATGTIGFTEAAIVPSIEFDGLSSDRISLLGTGDSGRPETAQASFVLNSRDGEPIADYAVRFSLTSTRGGLTLLSEEATTDSQGIVSTAVRAGTLAARTQVRATVRAGDNFFSALSEEILVSSGLPDQNSISLTADPLNVAGGDTDGLEVTITARLADHFNNPVPDGTAVNFATEYGAVGALCQTENGACTVTWISQEPRRSLNYAERTPTVENTVCDTYDGLGPCPRPLHKFQGGRSTVIATALGEESFTDANGNGRYDPGESFSDLAEAFIDHNEDDRYNPATDFCRPQPSLLCASGLEEAFFDVDRDGEFSEGNGLYNGSLCPRELDGADCSRELITVRRDIVIVASSADQRFALVDSMNRLLPESATISPGEYVLYIADLYNNPPPGGSVVALESEDCTIASALESTRPDTNAPGAWSVPIVLDDTENDERISGTVSVSLTLPDERAVFFEVACEDTTLARP